MRASNVSKRDRSRVNNLHKYTLVGLLSEDIVTQKWPFICSRSSKVIDFGTNRKRVYTFLLVINNNFSHILHRFGDMAA